MRLRPALLSDLGRACAALARIWWRRATTRRALSDLDARLLADIGRTETERRRECAKRFWQA